VWVCGCVCVVTRAMATQACMHALFNAPTL
jgi:hypothetical protein